MSVSGILKGLETVDATGSEAQMAARMGFLEWAFCAHDGGSLKAAQAALGSPAAQNARSDAARAFVGFLQEAAQALSRPPRRRRRLLH